MMAMISTMTTVLRKYRQLQLLLNTLMKTLILGNNKDNNNGLYIYKVEEDILYLQFVAYSNFA